MVLPTADGPTAEQPETAEGGSKAWQLRINHAVREYAVDTEEGNAHQQLFVLFKEIAEEHSQLGGSIVDLQRRAVLVEAQSAVLDAAAALPAANLKQAAYKLALWRHDYVRGEDEIWPRGDIVAASVFDDILFLSGTDDAALETSDEDDEEFAGSDR